MKINSIFYFSRFVSSLLCFIFISSCYVSGRYDDSSSGSISYGLNQSYFVLNSSVGSLAPQTDDSYDSYSVSPSLPTGLSFDTTTGIISGTPSRVTDSQVYVVTARNYRKTAKTALTFQVSQGFLVSTTADENDLSAGDGVCRTSSAACSLRAAIQEANALYLVTGETYTISIPAGTYTISSSLTVTAPMVLSGAGASSTIISAGGASLAPMLSVSNYPPTFTVSGLAMKNSAVSGISTAGKGIAIYAAAAPTIILKNCEFSNLTESSSAAGFLGGAIYWSGTSFTMDNCYIHDNSLTASGASAMNVMGGGLYLSANGPISISNTTLLNNQVSSTGALQQADGGGAFISGGSTISFQNLTAQNNSASALGLAGAGGAFYINGGSASLTITNSTLSSNSAGGSSTLNVGGAIYATIGSANSATLTNSTCSSNSISGTSANGGCLYLNGGSLNIIGSTISSNSSGNFGGAVYYTGNNANGVIQNSTFSNNTAVTNGAGIYYVNSGASLTLSVVGSTFSGSSKELLYLGSNAMTATVKNSTFSQAGAAYAVYINQVSTALENITVSNSNAGGGGVYFNRTGNTPTITVKNSIIDKSAGTACGSTGASGTLTSGGYNVARDATCTFMAGTDLQSTDPQLSALASNGGTTDTMAIAAASPAKDLVPLGSCSLTTDQRGTARPQGAACDAGAYER